MSLATRNALVYFFLFLVGLGVSGFVLFTYSSNEILKSTNQNVQHTGEIVDLKFDTYQEQLFTDLKQLSLSPLLANYINEPSAGALNLLSSDYQAFLKSRTDYFQIRLLTSDKTGKELIRVERKNNELVTVPDSLLQTKGDRDYFKEIIQLPIDSVYISKIDLNREFGKISVPETPTLRIAKRIKGTALMDEFVLILNVNLTPIFNVLSQLIPTNYKLRLLNDEGHYLIHPNRSAAFTFEYEKPAHYPLEFDVPIKNLTENGRNYSNDNSLSHFIKLNYPRTDYELFTIVSADKDDVFASFYSWRKKVLFVILSAALLFLLGAFLYMRKQMIELRGITKQLTLFSENQLPMELAINRNDEIGELAEGFKKMSYQISENHKTIKDARDEAENAVQEKNDFLENMSHEIRTPLQAILGATDILEQHELDPELLPFFDALKFSSVQLESLVTDILDYKKIEKGLVQLNPEWGDLEELCKNLISASIYKAKSKNITISFDFTERLKNNQAYFDPLRIYQILNNLLHNAIKFTPKNGNIEVAVKKTDDNVLVFAITDDGQGIAKADVDRILERNVTSDFSLGSGLGLTIVQQLLVQYNSQLKVKSALGQGSTFYFTLNLPLRVEKATQQVLQNDEDLSLQLLILEDDPILLDWYKIVLNGHHVKLIDSPDLLNDIKQQYDLIISDLNFDMDQKNPAEFCFVLAPHLQENGKLVFVSGDEIAPSEHYTIFKKPISKKHLINWTSSFAKSLRFGTPDFSRIEEDYDTEFELIERAMQLMITEWKKDSIRMNEAILTQNFQLFKAIKHKIITSVKRLKLTNFEQFLKATEDHFETIQSEKIAAKFEDRFSYFIQQMERYHSSIKPANNG